MLHRLLRGLLAAALAAAALLAPDAPAAEAAGPSGPGCDPLAPAECLLPFPNDWYTRPDPATDTGRRVSFGAATLPPAAAGRPVDPTAWNRSDGFSPARR